MPNIPAHGPYKASSYVHGVEARNIVLKGWSIYHINQQRRDKYIIQQIVEVCLWWQSNWCYNTPSTKLHSKWTNHSNKTEYGKKDPFTTRLFSHTSRFTVLGAGANARDRKIGALCSIPVKVAIQQTFSILRPRMKGPPGGPGCQFVKTRTKRYIATFWALVRLLSCFSIDLQYVCCVRGGGVGFHPP